jgi:hypothetical protein
MVSVVLPCLPNVVPGSAAPSTAGVTPQQYIAVQAASHCTVHVPPQALHPPLPLQRPAVPHHHHPLRPAHPHPPRLVPHPLLSPVLLPLSPVHHHHWALSYLSLLMVSDAGPCDVDL